MTTPIRVLLADDTLIAREGWRAILQTAPGIEIVGEAIVISEVVTQTRSLQPDVILLDLRWGKDENVGLRAIPKIKDTCTATHVVAISAYDELLLRARVWGADAILAKDFSREELLATIIDVRKTVPLKPPILEIDRICNRFAERLGVLKPGREDAKAYEHLMEELLPFLLGDHLSNFESQCRRLDGYEILDLVAFIGSNAPFWLDLHVHHLSNQIVFEMKNTQPPGGAEVDQLAGYLGDRSIHVGVMVTRSQPTPGATAKARNVYQKRGDVIFFLTDIEIQNMIQFKKKGDDPTECLLNVYLNFIRHPEQSLPHQ
jgi:CheY-like chemotaxis protein